MKLILVPGFWFDASSWDQVKPTLEAAGHDVTALTLPGMDSPDTDRSRIGLAEHVAAIVAAVDAAGQPVVLVGSSFAANLVHIVTNERPEAVALAVYVDGLPTPVSPTDREEPAGTEIAFSWDELSPDEQRDLSPAQRAEIEQRAIPFPAKVVRDGWVVDDERRLAVCSLIIASGFTGGDIDEWRAEYPEVAAELDARSDLAVVELPTSHWPHLTKPEAFAEILLDAI